MLGSIVSPQLPFFCNSRDDCQTDELPLRTFLSFRILITGDSSGLVETITDSVSVHSIKKAEYGRRMAKGASIVHVSLFDHFVNVSFLTLSSDLLDLTQSDDASSLFSLAGLR